MCDNLSDDEREQVRKHDKKRKINKRLKTLDKRNSIFNNIKCVAWLIHQYSQHQLSD